MTRNVHEIGADAAMNAILAQPGGGQLLGDVTKKIRSGHWSSEYVDSVGQSWRGGWALEQVAAFTRVHALNLEGNLAMVPIGTGAEPARDSYRAENSAALANLPHPFTAEVDMEQNNGDSDGTLSWSEPIEVSVSTRFIEQLPDGSTVPISLHYMIPPGEAPLEIGSSPGESHPDAPHHGKRQCRPLAVRTRGHSLAGELGLHGRQEADGALPEGKESRVAPPLLGYPQSR